MSTHEHGTAHGAGHDAAHDAGHDSVHPTTEECVDYFERIVSFIDNELEAADCAAVREHLDSCNPCLERYDLQRTVKAVVARSCSETAPTELRERVLLQLRQVRIEVTREG